MSSVTAASTIRGAPRHAETDLPSSLKRSCPLTEHPGRDTHATTHRRRRTDTGTHRHTPPCGSPEVLHRAKPLSPTGALLNSATLSPGIVSAAVTAAYLFHLEFSRVVLTCSGWSHSRILSITSDAFVRFIKTGLRYWPFWQRPHVGLTCFFCYRHRNRYSHCWPTHCA